MGIKKKDKTLKNSFRCRNTILARNWQKKQKPKSWAVSRMVAFTITNNAMENNPTLTKKWMDSLTSLKLHFLRNVKTNTTREKCLNYCCSCVIFLDKKQPVTTSGHSHKVNKRSLQNFASSIT